MADRLAGLPDRPDRALPKSGSSALGMVDAVSTRFVVGFHAISQSCHVRSASIQSSPIRGRRFQRTTTVTRHGRWAISQGGWVCRHRALVPEIISAVPTRTAR
jgi:hypothetical protein